MRDHSADPDERRSPGAAPPSEGRRRAYRLRHLLAKVQMPLFLAFAVLFGVWAWRSETGSGPDSWALGAVALLFAVLALLALVDVAVIRSHHHHRHSRR